MFDGPGLIGGRGVSGLCGKCCVGMAERGGVCRCGALPRWDMPELESNIIVAMLQIIIFVRFIVPVVFVIVVVCRFLCRVSYHLVVQLSFPVYGLVVGMSVLVNDVAVAVVCHYRVCRH